MSHWYHQAFTIPTHNSENALRFCLRTTKRHSSTDIFFHTSSNLSLPAAVLAFSSKEEQTSWKERLCHKTDQIQELSWEENELLNGLWLQGMTKETLQTELLSAPPHGAFWITKEESVTPLLPMTVLPLWLHPLPRAIMPPENRIADNTSKQLSMNHLLHRFVRRFRSSENVFLPHIALATGFLYRQGLLSVIECLRFPGVKTLRLLFSGRADQSTTKLLEQVFIKPLEEDETIDNEQLSMLLKAVEEERFCVRVYPHAFLHAKLFLGWEALTDDGSLDNRHAVIGSSNITGPGIMPSGNLELNAHISEKGVVDNLHRWFEARWEEAEEPKSELLEALTSRQAALSPPSFQTEGLLNVWRAGRSRRLAGPNAYLLSLANFYSSRLALRALDPNEPAYPIDQSRQITPAPEQEQGVLSLSLRLLQLRVGFLADSVGLGKTVTALGTAWYLYRTEQIEKAAVIAPRKLFSQWHRDADALRMPEKQIINYVNRHILERADEEKAAKLLDEADLLIVEEAHEALRSRKNKLWRHIRAHLARHPHKKLLMLSATPWNNKREDIFNYLLLAWQDGSRLYQTYPALQALPYQHYLRAFMGKPSAQARLFEELHLERYRDIFGETFVQRTRHRLEQLSQQSQDFPQRQLLPHPLPLSQSHDSFFQLLADALSQLTIPYRSPFQAIHRAAFATLPNLPEALQDEPKRSSIHTTFLIQLYKRAESSFYALVMTLRTILARLERLEQELTMICQSSTPKAELQKWMENRYLKLNQEAIAEASGLSDFAFDIDEVDTDLLSSQEKGRLGLLQMLMTTLDDQATRTLLMHLIQHDIVQDQEQINQLLATLTHELEQSDPKAILFEEWVRLHTMKQRKLLMIAGFADSACRMFVRAINCAPNARIGLALGGGEAWLYQPNQHNTAPLSEDEWNEHWRANANVTQITDTSLRILPPKERRKNLLRRANRAQEVPRDSLIQAFAPKAQKIRTATLSKLGGEVDILIGSEAVSVGQNLQDATALVHLDMPWNPMIIEQRIGRVDRRGGGRPEQPNNPESRRIVDVFYAWSHEAVEQEITLRQKLKDKTQQALRDTDFDEMLLLEVQEAVEEARRENQERTSYDGTETIELGTLLQKKQQELLHKQTQPEGIPETVGATAEGVRLLSSWAKDHQHQLDPEATPVVASGLLRHQATEQWLLTVECQPFASHGGTLGTPFFETIVVQPGGQSRIDMERAVQILIEAEQNQWTSPQPNQSLRDWTNALLHIDQILQELRTRLLNQHNDQLASQIHHQTTTSTPSTDLLGRFRGLCQQALQAIKAAIGPKSYFRNNPEGRTRIQSIHNQLAFLMKHLTPQNNALLLQQEDIPSVEASLRFIIGQAERFLKTEFDESFNQVIGGLWEDHQQEDNTNLSLEVEREGRWHSLTIKVRAAACIT